MSLLKIDQPAFAGVGALAGIGGVAAYVGGGNEPLSIPAYVAMAAGGAYLLSREESLAEAAGGMLLAAGIYGGYRRVQFDQGAGY